MRDILQKLNAIHGMKGALVITPDGLPIATDLPADMDAETTAGLGAYMSKLITEWASDVSHSSVALGIMESQQVRLFVAQINWGFLVAIAQKHCPLGKARVGMRQAADELNEVCARLDRFEQEEESHVHPNSFRRGMDE